MIDKTGRNLETPDRDFEKKYQLEIYGAGIFQRCDFSWEKDTKVQEN